jgi:hypothetical protein
VRAELELGDGQQLAVQLARAEADELELAPGDIVYVRSGALPRLVEDEPEPLSA